MTFFIKKYYFATDFADINQGYFDIYCSILCNIKVKIISVHKEGHICKALRMNISV